MLHGGAKRLASLEGLRGVAALIVVVWHTMLAFDHDKTFIIKNTMRRYLRLTKPLFVSVWYPIGCLCLILIISKKPHKKRHLLG